MLYHLLVGAVGTAALLGGWFAVQSLKRRTDPSIPQGEDVLACNRPCDGFGCSCAAMTGMAEPAEGTCPAHPEE
jgi:hypothetical protein